MKRKVARNRQIAKSRREGRRLAEIGERHGISRQRVHSILQQGESQMTRNLHVRVDDTVLEAVRDGELLWRKSRDTLGIESENHSQYVRYCILKTTAELHEAAGGEE